MYHLPEDQVADAVDWEDLVDHHLYSVTSLQELSIDTLSPLPKDEIYHPHNFSKFVSLYPAISTMEFVKASLSWVGIFGVPRSSESMEAPNSHHIWRKDSYVQVSASYHSPLSPGEFNGRS